MPNVERNGVRIYYEDVGAGPPVVLGHSFLCSGDMWRPQIEPLAESHRVINIDQRGHGRSGALTEPFDLYDMVDDALAVLDHLGIETAVWAGLSIGGMVAMRAAIIVPERVSGLILVDTHAGTESPFNKIKYRAMILCARSIGVRPLLPSIIQIMFGSTTRRENPDLVDEWRERFAAVHVSSISLAAGALIRRDSVVEILGGVRIPTAVIVGSEDDTLPEAYSKEIVRSLPEASLEVIPKSGHLSSLEQPEAVTRAMLEFLDGLEEGIGG